MRLGTLTIVGVGLIGGSIGLAAKRRQLAKRIVGVGRRKESLQYAEKNGMVDSFTLDLNQAVADADVVVFCTPVPLIAVQALGAAPHCPIGCLLTDAGSTKAAIVASLEQRLPDGVQFVGSHPLAGSEKQGPEHAVADLYDDRLTIVTQTPHTNRAALEMTTEFWQALGSRVRIMGPEEHDRALAYTSHLPHLLAAALASMLPTGLHGVTASGFRDTTRIAAGDPALWTGIFASNRPAVLEALQQLEDQLAKFRHALETKDEQRLGELLAQAKRVRDALGS
ncbi:MAG TPA: prephenate dehydrogenase/arogenate dehydrogenase family protein [Gemmataceae bacterium]|jgi:prephenate dehydrogenase